MEVREECGNHRPSKLKAWEPCFTKTLSSKKKLTEEPPPPGDAHQDLIAFLTTKLKGSSLQIRDVDTSRLSIGATDLLAIDISVDSQKKEVHYELYSPQWKRSIRVEELGGFDFMESRAEEDLRKLNLEANAEDVLLSIDLLKYWARANGYMLIEDQGTARPSAE